jgi:peptidyl-dipeptidase Dcp
MNNPLLKEWNTPCQTPPFNEIKIIHFKPAFDIALKSAEDQIAAIISNKEEPTFANTIETLEHSGEKLGRISSVLFNLNSAETSKELQAVARDISPLLTRFSNDITLNEKLFERIKFVYNGSKYPELNKEQEMLLERKYKSFINGGANLNKEKRSRFRAISEELSKLSLRFEENVLEETNSFELCLTDSDDLQGLPDGVVEMAAHEAEKRNKKGWVFTLHYPSYVPFMQYSVCRHLREKMLKAYSSRGFNGNEFDNREIVLKIVNLRLEIANILGYETFADFILDDRMADSKEKVNKFLDELFVASQPAAIRDFNNVCAFASGEGLYDPVERWDWAFYSEKLKKLKYNIDDEILKPYFSLDRVQDAVFNLATKLYGLTFRENNQIHGYHREVKAFEVYDSDKTILAILYLDYHPRSGKNGGAWMTSYREQKKINGKDIRPLVSIVTNFTRRTDTKPALLSFQELTTFLHEFGHALHGMLSKCTYESLSGTNVYRDFVELPSQFMENFAFEREWLETWATHYLTGEKIPMELIERIKEASAYNEGYACNRQLGFGFLDMAWHTISHSVIENLSEFEKTAASKTEMFPGIESANMSCSFGHLFSGGYAAGYYGYKWAEVLDADAFNIFRKKGIYDKETALSFRKNILEKGGTEKPMDLFIRFKGSEPSIDALLERSGFKSK